MPTAAHHATIVAELATPQDIETARRSLANHGVRKECIRTLPAQPARASVLAAAGLGGGTGLVLAAAVQALSSDWPAIAHPAFPLAVLALGAVTGAATALWHAHRRGPTLLVDPQDETEAARAAAAVEHLRQAARVRQVRLPDDPPASEREGANATWP